ncbi:Protease Do-like 2, chloroplastic [Sesamum alatum]|uniref:Protease Do-like 2, chloroplastic n=1 Tax=Sesamum alatum TaxID=300844 RepID=A0AAE1Z3X2_9LAMI|nr:Protease Do-like 2, chloroplastic [Sesamum alatum]
MSVAAANSWFSGLFSSGGATSSHSLSSHRLFCASRRPYLLSASKPSKDVNQNPVKGKPKKLLSKSEKEKEAVLQKFPSISRDGSSLSNADGRSTWNKTGRSQLTSYKSSGLPRKGNKGLLVDSTKQLVETGNLQDAAFLNAVVKVYCTHTAPDYSLPWQKQRQYTSTGSAFMIGQGKLLTNAHCVEHDTQVKVKRRGEDTKYVAKVLARGVECDIALLSVEKEEFWDGAEPLQLGRLPNLQDAVTVVGYPLGGETISVSKGVVSRIEVTSYAHGSSELLGIQIDAAINPGNSGGPAFNDQGECIGVAFQVYRSDDVENIGYVIPTTVVSHFLEDYERNGKYTGFPCLGVLLQKLENPALRACLNVPTNEGVLVRKVEPTSQASSALKEGDVIVSFDNVRVGCEGTVPFRSTERIAFRYLISQKFTGDIADIGIIRGGQFMKVQVVLNPRVHLVPYHIEGGQPSYLIVAGLVFTPLSEPLIEEECEDSIGLKLLAKARYSMAKFKGEQIVVLSQVLANEENIGYEDMSNEQVLKLNGTWIRNIHHLAHLVDSCKDKYLVFEFDDNFLVVLERESALAASTSMLKDYGIPSERSPDLLEPYVDSIVENEGAMDQHQFGDSPVTNSEFGYDGLLWAAWAQSNRTHYCNSTRPIRSPELGLVKAELSLIRPSDEF